jgi:hypothetical protein
MDAKKWTKLIRDHFAFLFEKYNFKIVSSVYEEEIFKDRITILESDEYIVEFDLERGVKLVVHISPKHEPSIKHPLRVIEGYLKGKPPVWPFYDEVGDEQRIEQLVLASMLFKELADTIFSIFALENAAETEKKINTYLIDIIPYVVTSTFQPFDESNVKKPRNKTSS